MRLVFFNLNSLQVIEHLELNIQSLQMAAAKHNSEIKFSQLKEAKHLDEIQNLRKQLNSIHKGRDFESELFKEKMTLLKSAEKVGRLSSFMYYWIVC